MSGNSKKLIAFNYFGGKYNLVYSLLEYFPVHAHFIDVFCGSMAIILNKPFSKMDTANDINSEIINFFKVIRQKPKELIRLLELTPVSREEYNLCWDSENSYTDLEKARMFYVRLRQSFYGLGSVRRNKGWHMVKTSSRSNYTESISKWHNGIDKLWSIIEKLTHIQIENRDFRKLIPKLDFPNAFFYCDPPYPKECLNSRSTYKYSFTNKDHRELSEVLKSVEGKVMISSYDCDLMQELYGDWKMIRFPFKYNGIRTKKTQECIWMNYDFKDLIQLKMF